jgi:hypothetical protein
MEDIKGLMPESELEALTARFRLEESGNVPPDSDPRGTLKGRCILRECGGAGGDAGLAALARARRDPPAIDTAQVTAYCALAATALAEAYIAFGDAAHLARAARCLARLRDTAWDAESYAIVRYPMPWRVDPATGESVPHALPPSDRPRTVTVHLDDYAYTVRALLDAYGPSGDPALLRLALALQRAQDARLWSGAGYWICAAVPWTPTAGAAVPMDVSPGSTSQGHSGAAPSSAGAPLSSSSGGSSSGSSSSASSSSSSSSSSTSSLSAPASSNPSAASGVTSTTSSSTLSVLDDAVKGPLPPEVPDDLPNLWRSCGTFEMTAPLPNAVAVSNLCRLGHLLG